MKYDSKNKIDVSIEITKLSKLLAHLKLSGRLYHCHIWKLKKTHSLCIEWWKTRVVLL